MKQSGQLQPSTSGVEPAALQAPLYRTPTEKHLRRLNEFTNDLKTAATFYYVVNGTSPTRVEELSGRYLFYVPTDSTGKPMELSSSVNSDEVQASEGIELEWIDSSIVITMSVIQDGTIRSFNSRISEQELTEGAFPELQLARPYDDLIVQFQAARQARMAQGLELSPHQANAFIYGSLRANEKGLLSFCRQFISKHSLYFSRRGVLPETYAELLEELAISPLNHQLDPVGEPLNSGVSVQVEKLPGATLKVVRRPSIPAVDTVFLRFEVVSSTPQGPTAIEVVPLPPTETRSLGAGKLYLTSALPTDPAQLVP